MDDKLTRPQLINLLTDAYIALSNTYDAIAVNMSKRMYWTECPHCKLKKGEHVSDYIKHTVDRWLEAMHD